MTPEVQLELIKALSPIVGAVATVITTVAIYWKLKAEAKKTADIVEKSTEEAKIERRKTSEDVKHVIKLANSALSKAIERGDAAVKIEEHLKDKVAGLKQTVEELVAEKEAK